LVFVTHNDSVMKAPYNENGSRLEKLWRTIDREIGGGPWDWV
jgi:hypothetical protein